MKRPTSTRPKSATRRSPRRSNGHPRGEYKKTARLLRIARARLGLSQATVAQHFNYHGQHVANWEAGISLPPVETLNKLSKILKIPIQKMIELRMAEVRQKWLEQLKRGK